MRPIRVPLADVRDLQLRVLRPRGPLPGDSDPPLDWVHLGTFADGRCVGAVSLGPAPWPAQGVAALPQPTWQLRSLAVADDARRSGVGAALLGEAVGAAAASRAAALWAAIRVEASGFYERLGWRLAGPEWDKQGVGPHRYGYVLLGARDGS